jgi:hypothetical protein
MKTTNIRLLMLSVACLCTIGLRAQDQPATSRNENALHVQNQLRAQAQLPTSGKRQPAHTKATFLTSEDGRALLQVSGSPISKSLNERFGEPSQSALDRARARWAEISAEHQQTKSEADAESVPCNSKSGARFNLEPRANAVFQNGPTADFILNGAGSGDDLIVQTANDWRGAFSSNTWDNSMTGYYVHTSKTADCSVQFEGGLPNIGGGTGLGESVVAADSTRGAFFIVGDEFIGPGGGYALFRASAADLMNPKICPPGTHLQKQAESCWMQTQPVLFDSNSENFYQELGLAVDERPSGTGAGDVYVVASDLSSLYLATCTTLLKCSSLQTLATFSENFDQYPYIQVRADGVITIAYGGDGTYPNLPIMFMTCTPSGAPNPPVCQQPVTVTTVEQAQYDGQLGNINLLFGAPLYPKFTNRKESNGQFTTFMVYDQCVNPYSNPPLPNESNNIICLNTEVNMTYSQDGGQTWSSPVSLTPKPAFHFFPTIANDASTGTVSIAYYSTEGDSFFRDTRVLLSQIAPGSTTVGPAKAVTTFTPIDDDPGNVAYLGAFDYRMGLVARGTGTSGQSHLYLSFDSEAVDGTYNKKPLPELNNFVYLIQF